jgi:hypothetical protein
LGLVAVPTVLAITILILDTPPELTNPYRGLENYFFFSSFPKSVWGAISFYFQRSFQMFYAIVTPHPLSVGEHLTVWVNLAFGILFILGVVTSWKRPAFPVVLYLLCGVAGHVVLNLLSLVPYGNPRYFLNFFLAIPFVIALGGVNIVTLIVGQVNSKSIASVRILKLAFLVVVSTFLVIFFGQVRQYNESATNAIHSGILISNYSSEANQAALIVDLWTQKVVQAEHQEIRNNPLYVLNTNLKTKWRGQSPGELDDIREWKRIIAEQKALSLVTSMPFTKSNYGELYELASDNFETFSSHRNRSYNFAVMLRKNR